MTSPQRPVPPEYTVEANASLDLPDYDGGAPAYELKTDALDACLPLIEPAFIHKRSVTEWTAQVHAPGVPAELQDPSLFPDWKVIARLWLRRKFITSRGFEGDVQADLLLTRVYPFLTP